MNRKKRNFEKMDCRKCRSMIGAVFEGERIRRFDADPVNRNRKAAKLRRLYHRCADWDCPKWQLNEKLCEHCQHLYRCYAKLSWLINAWPGLVNLQEGRWRYVPRSRAKACE
jgi:hypothetical protein